MAGKTPGAFVAGSYIPAGRFSPNQGQTVVLLPLDGTNGQTTITDDTGRIWTRTGTGVAISTAQSVAGGASLLFSDTGANSDFNTPAGVLTQTDRFTMEGWVYLLGAGFGLGNRHALIAQGANVSSGEQGIWIDNAGKLGFLLRAGNASGPEVTAAAAMSLNAWHHIAVTFDPALPSGQWKGYVDGVLALQVDWATGWINTALPMQIGRNRLPSYNSYRWALNGYMDMWRIKKGVVLYPGDFTPPTPPLGL